MKKRKLEFNLKPYCSHCGSYELKTLKSGAIVCENCGMEEFFDKDKRILYTKIKVKDKFY